ncbi:nitroreductase family protein [Anaerobacillus sp. CMMVII]|uniref:nitroreductase family protein n=1 Tax=Anaerobacillus sp. CMMVII TaxID=2755588 RepID=UPI0021B75676|nr:nitroreductase family protein [Anaerobacillus sp. CMMVII]MCT8138282.1 nitroreductase family protein [Anaerobacillus sp. CMMVII]
MGSTIEIIKKRKSVRTFETTPLTSEHLKQVNEYLKVAENLVGPLGRKARFEVIQIQNNVSDKGIKLGTYGFIKNHQGYIVGIMENTKMGLVEFGYIFEKFILFATELGIGTCWIGGTFNRNSFAKEINLSETDFIPCITPIGYAKEKQRLFDKTLRYVTKADNKKAWHELFFKSNFENPVSKEDVGDFAVPIEMVRLGPSASNKQPWRIIFSEDKNEFYFYLAHTPNYNKLGFDMQLIDIGIAMCHFELACKETKLDGRWTISDPGHKPQNEHTEYIISWVANK